MALTLDSKVTDGGDVGWQWTRTVGQTSYQGRGTALMHAEEKDKNHLSSTLLT